MQPGISGISFVKGELHIAPIFNQGAKASMKLSGHSEASEILGFLNEGDLDLLSKNKPSANDDQEQTTLTDYFGFHSWLIRNDVGVGAQLYNRAASPKLLMKSFQITISCALTEIIKAKHALIDLFIEKFNKY